MTTTHGSVSVRRILLAGSAAGPALVLDEPLSFWGGVDPATGEIIDRRHPQCGGCLRGTVLAMPSGRGSSSSSSVLAECVRAETAPAAILLSHTDGILLLGALVARELYGRAPPVLLLSPDQLAAIRTGDVLRVTDGALQRDAQNAKPAPR